MNDKERGAWFSFAVAMENFLDNKKANNYRNLITNLLSAFYDLGCNMSVKLHFLCSHLDRFPEYIEAVSDEQCERFHQGLKTMVDRYQGKWNKHDGRLLLEH